MTTTSIPDNLRPYVPPSFYQGDSLKPGIDVDQAIQVAQGIQARAEALPPAQAELFLAMVRSGDIAPGGEIPADLARTLDTLANVSAMLGDGSIWKDSLDVLARAMVEQSAEQRQNALKDRLSARDQAKTELLSQAETLKNQASELKDGAMKAMIISIVLSATSIVMSAGSAVGFKIGGAKTTTETGATAANGISGAFSSMAQSVGQIGQAGSGYASTSSQAKAKEYEAQGQIDAAESQTQQSIADIKKEAQDTLNEMVKSIINFLKELQDAKAQQMQAMTRV